MRKYLALKVGLLLGLVFLLVAVFGWDLLQDMKHLQQEALVVEDSNHQSHELHDIEMHVYASIKTVNDFLIAGDHRLVEQFQAQHQQLLHAISQYEESYTGISLSSLLQSVNHIKTLGNKVFNLPFATDNMEGPILVEEIARETRQAIQQLADTHHNLDGQVNRAMQMMEGLRLDMQEETMALVFILFVVMSLLTYFIYSQIVLPIVQMKKEVQRVGLGKFDVDCKVSSQDEIGELGKAFNAMGQALGERELQLNRTRSLTAHQEKMNAMGVMAAGIAHEVGNPLASLAMLLQLAKRKLKQQEPEVVEGHLQSALQETERMESIIQRVLDYGRYEPNIDFQSFKVQPVIEDAIRLAQMVPQHKRVPIAIDVENHATLAYASDSMLMQVLINLIYNAFHACKQEGEIHINVSLKTFSQRDFLVIDVCDSGHGIPDEIRAAIFQPSFSTKERGEGTGLGLAISKELIEGMSGTLELLDDEALNTCFRICLPNKESEEVL